MANNETSLVYTSDNTEVQAKHTLVDLPNIINIYLILKLSITQSNSSKLYKHDESHIFLRESLIK